MDNKTVLREKAKAIRKSLNIIEISRNLVEKIRDNYDYKIAKNVMLYYPTKFEMNFLELLNDAKEFYLPKIDGEDLLVCPYKKGQPLEHSSFKTLEPLTEPIKSKDLDLIIVPALMVDGKNFRLGYGGGFYDRFLKTTSTKTLTALPKELFIDTLPVEKFDLPIDIIILH